MLMDEMFEAFVAVREQQSAHLPSGLPAYQAFVQGGCHILAYAVQDRLGGDLVVVTPRDEPDSIVHVGVLRDGIVTDAAGHSDSGYWSRSWALKAAPDAMFRYTTREEIETRLKPYDLPTESGLMAAGPLADALAAAVPVDVLAWRSMLPVGSMLHIGPDPCREDRSAYDAALAAGDRYGFPPAEILPPRAASPLLGDTSVTGPDAVAPVSGIMAQARDLSDDAGSSCVDAKGPVAPFLLAARTIGSSGRE